MCAVAERLLGARVHFDQEAVCARRRGGEGEREHQLGPAGRMRRIDDHRQMCPLLHQSDGREIERVARRSLERADAAFAEDDLVVPSGEEVLGREQPFLDGRRRAALEQHGPPGTREDLEEREILHVACADLEQRGTVERGKLRRLHHFGYRREAVPLGGVEQELRSLRAQTLERVRARSRFEGAAPQHRATGVRHGAGSLLHLGGTLDGAGTRHDHESAAAQFDRPAGSGEADERRGRTRPAFHQRCLFGGVANWLHQSLQNVLKQVVCSWAREDGQAEGASRHGERHGRRPPARRTLRRRPGNSSPARGFSPALLLVLS